MQEINQSVLGYLRIFFRRKWMLIIPTFTCFILGICAVIVLPKEYKSSTTILVQEGKTDNPLFNNIAVSSSMSQRAQAIKETMLGWDSLVKLVKRLNLDKNVKTDYEFEALITQLRKDIDIYMRDGNLIDLSYVAMTAQQAQAVVLNITNIFIERNVEVQSKETFDAIRFIEEQLHVYRGKIKSAEIAEVKDRLNALLTDSTEAHPLVKDLRNQINSKMESLKKENLEYSEDTRLTADTTNPMLDQIKKTLDTITEKAANNSANGSEIKDAVDEKDLYKVMLIDTLDNVMARDVSVNETIYNSLLQRLETAKITQRLQASKEGTRYMVLDPPRVPLHPIKPNKVLVIIIGLFLGLTAGVTMVLLSEFLDKSFLDVQEASVYVGAPLLGVISKITTQESIEEEKQKTQWILISLGAVGVVMISMATVVAVFISPV